MAVYGYARCSTDHQKLDVQMEQLASFGCDKIYQEKVSGKNTNRPELLAMLKTVVAGDMVVVCKLDRIARSTRDLLSIVEELDSRSVAFKVLNADIDTSTATGKMMLTVLGAIATFERELMLERQREGIERARAEGKYKGREPSARNQSARVMELLAGGMTRAAVAAELGMGIASVYRIVRDNRKGER